MNTKKIAVIVLSVMAVALMVAAIAIGIQLANNQSPTDTGAAGQACAPGISFPGCNVNKNVGDACSTSTIIGTCQQQSVSGGEIVCQCSPPSTPVPTTVVPTTVTPSTPTPTSGQCRATGCSCTTNSGCTNNYCDLTGGSPGFCSFPPTVVPTSTQTPTITSTPTPTQTGCGPAGCDGDTRPQCYPYVAGSNQLSIENSDCSVKRTGDSCTQKNSSGTSTGVAGKCQNAPSCSCVANATPTPTTPIAHSCGQHCNQGTGLCASGYTCTFDNPTCQTNGIYNNTTYCVPNSVYAGLPKCASQYNNTDRYIVNAGGAVTESYILSLCPITTTPLPTDAQGNVIPVTAVVSDKLDPILLGLLLVIFGVSLYPRIKFKRPGRTS